MNLEKIIRRIFLCIKIISLGFFIYGTILFWNSSKLIYPLLTNGKHLDGVIVGYDKKSWRHDHSSSGFMVTANLPIVEFIDSTGGKNRFIGRNGHPTTNVGKHVKIIYSNSNKKNARIDEGVFNTWIDAWISLFIIICSFLGVIYKPPKFDILGALSKNSQNK